MPLAELEVVPAAVVVVVDDAVDAGPPEELLSSLPEEPSPSLLLVHAPTAIVAARERAARPLKRVMVRMVAPIRRSGPKVSPPGEQR